MPGHLILIPTPIGNLEDITYRSIKSLKICDLIACEDTRRTNKLIKYFCIKKPLIHFDDHANDNIKQRICHLLTTGLTIGYCSDAGMPGINDPGYTLVKLARKINAKLTILPGPSAVTLAIVASGLSSHAFSFWGFLPYKITAKTTILTKIALREETNIIFETKHRLNNTLMLINNIMPNRQIAIGRELTKLHETWYFGTIKELTTQLKSDSKGEFVIVISGCAK